MPYSAGEYPPSYKNISGAVRSKAVEILNALLKTGMDEGVAIATALSKARGFIAKHSSNSEWKGFVAKIVKESGMKKRTDVNPDEGKKKYGDVTFADEKNKKYPIDTPEHINAAWKYLHMPKNAGKYSASEVAAMKAKIVAAWKKKIDKAGPPSVAEHSFDLTELPDDDWYVEQFAEDELQGEFAVVGTKFMTREQVHKKCAACSAKMGNSGQEMPVDAGGHMNHICGAAGRAIEQGQAGMQQHQPPPLEYSNAIKGVEIFCTGTHNGDEYTEKDLDEIVSAFKELDYRPAIKVGHTKDHDEKTSTPAYGWVRNLRKVGTKLVADFEDMHDSVVEAIRKRQYDRVSSEIYFNLKRMAKDGTQKIFGKALKAVALLGAEVPAVANLVPLHKMEFAEKGSFEGEYAFEADLSIPTETLVETLAQRVSGLVNLMKEFDMAKHAEKIAALQAQVAEYKHRMEDMKKKMEGMDDDADDSVVAKATMKKLEEDITKTEAEIKQLSEDDNTTEELRKQLEASQAQVKANQAETKALTERLAKLEQTERAQKLGSKVKACLIPAFRPSLEALYSYALEHGEATVKVFSTDKDGKTTSEDKPLTDMVDGLVSQINTQHEKLFKALAFTDKQVKEFENTGAVDSNGDVSVEVDQKVKAYRLEHKDKKIGYSDAMKAVLAADQDLAARYREQQGQGQ